MSQVSWKEFFFGGGGEGFQLTVFKNKHIFLKKAAPHAYNHSDTLQS